MKLWIPVSVVIGVLLVAVPRAASAADVQPAPQAVDTVAAKAADEVNMQPSNCLRYTGSRIERSAGHCIHLPGRVYRQEDLALSGELNLNDALRRLDPRLN